MLADWGPSAAHGRPPALRTRGTTLSDLLAAYSLFADPRHRELVAQSAALGLRQKELADRALQVVEAGRTAEHDPLVLAWLESLGDEAGTAMPPRERPEPSPPGGRELAIMRPISRAAALRPAGGGCAGRRVVRTITSPRSGLPSPNSFSFLYRTTRSRSRNPVSLPRHLVTLRNNPYQAASQDPG